MYVVYHPSCLVCCPSLTITIALNNISSEITRPRAFIFGMYHCLVDLYQVCSDGGPGVYNGPAAGGIVFKNEIYLKWSSPELLGSDLFNKVPLV